MPKLIDLTGQRFGSWTVISRANSLRYAASRANPYGYTAPVWFCQCDCGTYASVTGGNLRSGRSTCCHICRDKKRAKGLRRYHQAVARMRAMFPGEFEA